MYARVEFISDQGPGGDDSHGASHFWLLIRTSDQARASLRL
jgi:hypothetical protein